MMVFNLQLYELDDDPNRKEFLDELFVFMQKRGKYAVSCVVLKLNIPLALLSCICRPILWNMAK